MPDPRSHMDNLRQFPAAKPAPPAAPLDQNARQHALEVDASWIVEAPAGSGKTGLLVQRYLKLLGDESVSQPEEILAITFTRKATTELRERILKPLEEARSENPTQPISDFYAETLTLARRVLERDAARGWNILDRPQRLAVRTIDSVCADIAATLPLLSGSGPARTPSNSPGELYREAAQRTLMQLGGPDSRLHQALRTVLLHRDANLADCETLLAAMLEKREQWGELVPLGDQLDEENLETVVRPRLENALETIVCTGLTRAAKAMPPDMLAGLSWLAGSMSAEPGYKRESPIAICSNKNEPPEERAEHLDHWLALISLLIKKDGEWRNRVSRADVGFEITPAGKARLTEILDEARTNEPLRLALCDVRALPPARYPDEQWIVAKALFFLLIRALAELKVLFAERGQCDFTELAIAAKEVLRTADGPTDLASAAGSAIRHLLVDEMQDTSSGQYELIELLTRSWDGHSQTLFLVGDPKQSIYLFRQARVERFLRAMREKKLGDIPLGALYLSANFRSQALLVEDFNSDFEAVFPSHANTTGNAIDVPFVHADPVRGASPIAAGRVWHVCIKKETTHDPDAQFPEPPEDKEHRQHEARSIRRIVEAWQQRPLPPGREKPWRIAVLARTRDHLAETIQEFHRPDAAGNRIEFRAVDIERLGEQAEVLDLLALTRALLHPADRTAWLAVLHAPWCGLGIADLLALAGNGSLDSMSEPVPAVAFHRRDLLSLDGRTLFDRTWPILETALAQRGRTSTAAWVERTWRSLGADATLNPQQHDNAALFFNALREIEAPGGLLDLSLLAKNVGKLFIEPRSATAAVTLSTMHNAKGLEWDVVIIPGLERPSRHPDTVLLNWLELDSSGDAPAQVVLAPIWGKGGQADPLYTWLNKVRAARDDAERKRLFYVAGTRAQEELHLFAAATRNAAGDLYAPAGTLLKAAWPAALPFFEELSNTTAVATPATAEMFRRALEDEDDFEDQAFAIAAGAEPRSEPETRPLIHRLPLSFNPSSRFEIAAANRLPYTPATTLRQGPDFERPEGSYTVRAFGNVVHRYLQVLSARLEANPDAAALQQEIPTWLPRLVASLRAEGLTPATLDRLAQRSLQALQQTLADEIGLWILSPHATSHSEQALHFAAQQNEIRVDRTFLAGPDPLSEGSSHLWIVDFKTTDQGSRSPDLFVQQEKAKYSAQLESYARAQLSLQGATTPVIQGLYYPLIPRLIHW